MIAAALPAPPARPASSLARVVACVSNGRRKTLDAALSDQAEVVFCATFDELRSAGGGGRPWVAILEPSDADGASASSTADLLQRMAPPPILVLYAPHRGDVGEAMKSPFFSDVIVAGETDRKIYLQSVVVNAFHRIAADRVVRALKSRLPGPISTFGEAAVRFPDLGTVAAVADHLRVHRQTVPAWCRSHRFLRAEEVLVWCRLLLVSAMLDLTDRTVAALAADFGFPSTVALRNQIKRYTGLTALEVRAKGLDEVLGIFDWEVNRARLQVPGTEERGPRILP